MSEKPLVSVVLPTYNEALNIGGLIQAIIGQVQQPLEVIVVDDDSPDGTWQVVAEMAKAESRLHLIRRINERGLTSAIQAGIDAAQGEVIVWMDCDFSHPPELIPQLLEKVFSEGYDIAVASRYVEGGQAKAGLEGSQDSWLGVFFSRALNIFTWAVLGSHFKDYTSGFIAIRKRVLAHIRLRGDYGEYFIDMMVRAMKMGYKYVEIPFVNRPRLYGESKTGTNLKTYLRRGIKYIITVLRVRFSSK